MFIIHVMIKFLAFCSVVIIESYLSVFIILCFEKNLAFDGVITELLSKVSISKCRFVAADGLRPFVLLSLKLHSGGPCGN